MILIRIGGNEATGRMLGQAISEMLGQVEFRFYTQGRQAILALIECNVPPDYILIDCKTFDVKCDVLLGFIKRNPMLMSSKIIVTGNFFSERDRSRYQKMGATDCIGDQPFSVLTEGLKKHFAR